MARWGKERLKEQIRAALDVRVEEDGRVVKPVRKSHKRSFLDELVDAAKEVGRGILSVIVAKELGMPPEYPGTAVSDRRNPYPNYASTTVGRYRYGRAGVDTSTLFLIGGIAMFGLALFLFRKEEK